MTDTEVGVASSQGFLLHCPPPQQQSVSMATPPLISLQYSATQLSSDSPLLSSSLLPYNSVLPLKMASPPLFPSPPSSLLPSPSITGHRSYTLEFKLSVVDWIQSTNASIRAASKQFGVDRKLIRTWLNSKETLSSALVVHGPNRRKLHRGARPISEAVDRHVLHFLAQQRQSGIQVVEKDLQLKALECSESLGLATFKATSTWVRGWKHRHGVEWRSGTYEIVKDSGKVPEHGKGKTDMYVEVKGSALLSHVNVRDRVKLPVTVKRAEEGEVGCGGEREGEREVVSCLVEGTVELDFSAQEHSYAKPVSLAPPPSLTSPPPVLTSAGSAILDHSCDHAYFLSSLTPHSLSPHLDPPPCAYESMQIELFDPEVEVMMIGDISALELPLGHEEVVTDCDLVPPASRTKRPSGSPRKPVRGRGRGGRLGSSGSSIRLSPTSVATFAGLEEGGGLGGMLANRLSQPVFPAGPEIVYIDAPTSSFSMSGCSQ